MDSGVSFFKFCLAGESEATSMVLILSQLIGSVIVGCMPLVNLLLVPEKMALLCTKVTGGRHYSGDQPWDFL